MSFMAPKKRKSSKVVLKDDEKPEIALDFSEGLEAEIKKAVELAKVEKKDKHKEDGVDKGEKIKQNIDKVKVKEGVIGYILRNSTSASIDLKDPTKIIDYAVLSSSALEASEELSNTFELGNVKHVVVEGNTVKLLSFTVGENKVSVFMEKDVNHNRIYKDLLG
jgi:predicted regulator of Ras-like GTPase activity (Roadblock/LC7/MglB family)